MSYIKRQKGLNGVGAVVEDDIASFMQKLPPIAGRGRSGLSSFVSNRAGYVRTGLGAVSATEAAALRIKPNIRASVADLKLFAKYFYDRFQNSGNTNLENGIMKALHPDDRSVFFGHLDQLKLRPVILSRIKKDFPAKSVVDLSAILRRGVSISKTTAPIITVRQADTSKLTPEELEAYRAKQAADAAALAATRAGAARIVNHSGGETKYVRDNTPEGLKAQAEGRLQTIESGGSGILTPPTPEQAASPTPVTPDGTQALAPVTPSGGLLSGKLPWIIGGGVVLLGLVLLTRKKSGAKTR